MILKSLEYELEMRSCKRPVANGKLLLSCFLNYEPRTNTHRLRATSFNYELYKPYELNGPNRLYEPRSTRYPLLMDI